MNITVRKAQIRDIPDILKMNEKLNGEGQATTETMKNSLKNNKNEIVFAAVCGGRAVGFICGRIYPSICYSESLQCEITELYVDEDYRRKGAATMLIKRVEQEFAENNAHEIVLLTGINNAAAQKFYESRGYAFRRKAYLKNV